MRGQSEASGSLTGYQRERAGRRDSGGGRASHSGNKENRAAILFYPMEIFQAINVFLKNDFAIAQKNRKNSETFATKRTKRWNFFVFFTRPVRGRKNDFHYESLSGTVEGYFQFYKYCATKTDNKGNLLRFLPKTRHEITNNDL